MSELFLRLQTLANLYSDPEAWDGIIADYGEEWFEELEKSILADVEEMESFGINPQLCRRIRQFVETGKGLPIEAVSAEEMERLEKEHWQAWKESQKSPRERKEQAVKELVAQAQRTHESVMSGFRSSIAQIMKANEGAKQLGDTASLHSVLDGLETIYDQAVEARKANTISDADLEEITLLVKGETPEAVREHQKANKRLELLAALRAKVKDGLREFGKRRTESDAKRLRALLTEVLNQALSAEKEGVFSAKDVNAVKILVSDARSVLTRYGYREPSEYERYKELERKRAMAEVHKQAFAPITEETPGYPQAVRAAQENTYEAALRKHRDGKISDDELAEIAFRLLGGSVSKDELLKAIQINWASGNLYTSLGD